MKTLTRFLFKAFLFVITTAAIVGVFLGGIAVVFVFARWAAPVVVVAAVLVWSLMRAAKYAEDEENQALNLAKAMREQKEANKGTNAV